MTVETLQNRRTARLAAVQALYQMETSGAGVEKTIADFRGHWMGADIDGEKFADADAGFFDDIVRGVVRLQMKIDPAIERRLSSKWTLARLDATARAILRAGAYELLQHSSTPSGVILDEYVEIAGSFFGETERSFVNAALDGVARDFRPSEPADGGAGARRA